MHTLFNGLESISTATDSWFRQFERFSDALAAAGFVQTADTGQVDWSTATVPAASNYSNYEVWRFDDADQSTWPVFFRIGYGFTTQTTQHPRIQIQFGTGSDGSGNLTGFVSTLWGASLGGSTTDRDWLFGADESGFALLAGVTGTIARNFIGVERARDIDGNTVPQYLLFYLSNASTTYLSPTYDSPTLRVVDFDRETNISSDTIPVYYWRDLSSTSDSLAMGMLYPFGVIQFPTPLGMVRNKLMIGAAYYDFTDESFLDVPRFSSNTLYRYRLELKESSGNGGAFGYGPSGVSTTVSDTPSAYAMPCIFWD